MLASYIEYASTHEVNEEYRNSLLAATDAATQVNMVAGALKNPAVMVLWARPEQQRSCLEIKMRNKN